jgi:FkbM family methyltransferase
MITETDLNNAYRLLLNREVSPAEAIYWTKRVASISDLIPCILDSEEFKSKYPNKPHPSWHYHSSFDAEEIIRRHKKKDVRSSSLHVTNFLGVKTRPEVLPDYLSNLVGTVQSIPIPANWHADIAEWASCLRAVDFASASFVMAELGCGWGCWMNNLGRASKDMGKRVKLYGIEADLKCLEMAKKAFADNGFERDEYELKQGILGKTGDVVSYPKNPSGLAWNGATASNNESFVNPEHYIKVPIINFEEVIRDEFRLDLLHIDIQGNEYDLLCDIFELISRKVRFVFVGTHTRQIEGKLFDLFLGNSSSWSLEMEQACKFKLFNGWPILTGDGAQLWRNKLV